MIKLQFFGPLTIRKEDGSLDQSIPKGAKRVAVLVYLVLAKPRGFHRRDELLALFWPNLNQKSARNSLSNILYHLRDALGKDVIINRGSEEICINTDKIWCDVLAFEKAKDNNDLKKAFQFYKSELLSGFHIDSVSNNFQDWLDNERTRLRKEFISLCWNLAEREKEIGNTEDAHLYAETALNLSIYSDKNQRRFIEFLVSLGKLTEAKKAFKKYATHLKTEFDSEPPSDLKNYIESLEHSDTTKTHEFNDHPVQKKNDPPQTSVHRPTEKSAVKSVDESANHLTKSDRYKKTLFRNILIFLAVVAGLWFIGRSFFNSGTQTPINNKSVAVLPFTYINAPDSTDFFSLGITEEILSKLARISDLSVISRTSVMQYQNSDKSIREIARELDVASVVEGSVQKYEDQVRITAQLIDAETDQHLWGDTYDRQIENILLVQSEVAARIADALQTELLPYENSEYTPNQNVDELAYQLYLQAKQMLDIHNPDGIVESVDIFRESISIDSTFAPAYGGLSLAYLYSGLLSRFDNNVTGVEGMDLRNAAKLSLQASNQALSINPNVVEAYLAQAIIFQRINKNWEQSEEKFLSALSLNPNHSDVRSEYGAHLLFQGNIDEALIHMEKAVAVDPLSWTAHHGLGYTYYCNREYEKAIRELETSIRLGSRYPDTKKHLSLSLLKRSQELFQDGQDEEAMAMIERGSTILNEIWGTNTGWKETVVFAAMGNKGQTIQSIQENPLPFPPMLYSLLLVGQTDEVLELLDSRLNFSINRTYVDPIFDSVRDNPRFQEIVEEDLGKAVF